MCAWGFFNKIKKGLKKAFNFAKDKIVKPIVNVAKKVAPVIAPAIDTIAPGGGAIFNHVVNGTDKALNGDYSAIADALRSGKIRLK